MAEAKYTPGPWRTMAANPALVLGGNPSFLIANCMNGRSGHVEDEPNARLIAAAPELLEACRAYIADRRARGLSMQYVFAEQMLAAIAKATGGAQ